MLDIKIKSYVLRYSNLLFEDGENNYEVQCIYALNGKEFVSGLYITDQKGANDISMALNKVEAIRDVLGADFFIENAYVGRFCYDDAIWHLKNKKGNAVAVPYECLEHFIAVCRALGVNVSGGCMNETTQYIYSL